MGATYTLPHLLMRETGCTMGATYTIALQRCHHGVRSEDLCSRPSHISASGLKSGPGDWP